MRLRSPRKSPSLSKRGKRNNSGKSNESGYALLVIVFLATLMLLAAMAAAPNVLTEGRREQEKEMIWRGKQYIRGVKLYYRKFGRFPTSLDDLTKPKVGSLRFMRQAYKDPMNAADGTWRFIYVGPNGQLIGSLKPHPVNLQMPQTGGIGSPANPSAAGASPPAGGIGSLIPVVQPGVQAGTSPQPGTPPAADASGTASATAGSGTTGAPVGTDQTDSGTTGLPPPLTDTSNIIGGNIIGVGSKIDKSSIIIYDKAKNYRLFEFIWDPSKDVITVGQPGQTGTGFGQPAGQPLQSPSGPGVNPANPSPPGPQPRNPQQQP